MEDLAAIERRASRIKLLLMDCDGVLTDGRLWLMESGDEQKCFNTHDGQGLNLLHRAGLQSGVISGRTSGALTRRAKDLGIAYLHQGNSHKLGAFAEILSQSGCEENEVAYVGDDFPDIPIMRRAELAVAVGDALQEVKLAAHYVTRAVGGRGAVREVVELILKSQGRWNDLVEEYLK